MRLNIGSVWRMTVDIVRRHFNTFMTLAAAFVFLPSVLASALFPQLGVIQMPVPGQSASPFPGGLLLLLIVTMLIGLVGHFSIGAIAADPAEGGGRSIGEIITGVLPKIGKGLLVGLYLIVAYVTVGLAVGIVTSIIAAMFAAVGGSARVAVAAGGTPPMALVMAISWLIVAIVLPLTIWVSARLIPTLGVLLRESLSAIDSIKRAWALSRGSTAPLAGVVLLMAIVSVLLTIVFEQLQHALGINTGISMLFFTVVKTAVTTVIAVGYYAAVAVIYRQLSERH